MSKLLQLSAYIDLSRFYPELESTNQLEHYCDMMLHLFAATFVSLKFEQQSHTLVVASHSAKSNWVDWCTQQPKVTALTCEPFFIPGYHIVIVPLGRSGQLFLVRDGSAHITSEQQEALTWLCESIDEFIKTNDFIPDIQEQVIAVHLPPWQCQPLEQCRVEWKAGQLVWHDRLTSPLQQFLQHSQAVHLLDILSHEVQIADHTRKQRLRLILSGSIMVIHIAGLSPQLAMISFQDYSPIRQVKALRQQQHFLKGLFECGLAAMVGLDQQNHVVYGNQAARSSLWLPEDPQRARQRLRLNYLHFYRLQGDTEQAIEPFAFVMEGAPDKPGDRYRIRYPDGTSRVFAFWWVTRHDLTEPDVVWYCLFMDMTEQYQLQQALGDMQHHIDSLLQFSPVIAYQSFEDLRRGFIFISPNVERLLGFNQLSLMQDPKVFFEHVHPDDVADFGLESSHREFRCWSEISQSYVWLKDIRNQDPDSPDVYFGALTNITARKEAEEHQLKLQAQLEGQKQILSRTLDSLIDGVITINQTGLVLSCNPAVERLFGYAAAEVVGQNIRMLMPPEVSVEHDNFLLTFLRTGKSKIIGKGREMFGLRKDGQKFPVHIAVTELPGDKEGMRYFVGCLHDLTETRKQQQQLVQASKLSALGTLTSGIAHDFNNILGIMRGYAEMLSLHADQQVLNYASNIMKAADRGSALTRSMLDFSSNRSREQIVCDLNALITDIQQLLVDAAGKKVTLHLALDAPESVVELEKGGLENAIVNMVINARHAMKGEGDIWLSTRACQYSLQELQSLDLEGDDFVELRIRDNGSGMTDEVKQRLFEPFFTTKGADGTGLGLAQVFGFVRRAQGTVQVVSELGHGTEFILILPRSVKRVPLVEAKTSALKPVSALVKPSISSSSEPHTVLIVDDEPELLDVHSTMLEAAGFRVFTAASGDEALTALAKYQVDVLLSDIVMPQMDGLSLAVQARERYPALKIQMVSGFADLELVNDPVKQQLFDERLTKPVSARNLINKIKLLTL